MYLGWRFWTISAIVVASPAVLFLALLANPGWDRHWGALDFHFWAVSGTALSAASACAVVIASARSMQESRVLFLGLGFMSIAAIFAVHGLVTPGHIHDAPYAEMSVSAWLSVFMGALFVACSAVTMPDPAVRWIERRGSLVFGGVALALGFYVGLSLSAERWLEFVPIKDRWLQLSATAMTLSCLGLAAWRYYQSFLFARLPSQWAMVVALLLLMQVQASMTWGRFWHFSWWEYHFLYASAFVVVFSGWVSEALRAGGFRSLAEALTMRDALAQLDRGHNDQILDLLDEIELKDVYTLGHVRRVAAYALLLGREMQLTPAELRNLALAAQMHDIGKIGTPDRILSKPGPLTREEFAVIKEHAQRGYEIACQVAALRPVAAAIRSHHEKVDGSGYPLGLKGEAIPLLSRMVAVVDAFDAMTSGRVYQAPVAAEAAFEELRRCSGSHFDAACVRAFLAALAKEPAALRELPVVRRPLAESAA